MEKEKTKEKPKEQEVVVTAAAGSTSDAPPATPVEQQQQQQQPQQFSECEEYDEDDDPKLRMKEDLAIPTGLVNKGALCYMNALLQSLFVVKSFREGVFRWRDEPAGSPENAICRELQKLFVRMHATNNRYVDPEELVDALKLDTRVQQDAQEFYKLFVSHIEERFKAEASSPVASLVEDHFQGQYSYITTCKSCGTSSRRPNSFTELELSIEKHSTIEDCLAAFVAEEELTGANQYHCATCDAKRDATRRIAIERLPPVLNLQLLRFQFDLATLAKKKVRSNISFPFVLDMRPFVADAAEALEYELFVALIHRGTSANGGHYVCHARPEGSEKWFEFDDTNVKEMNLRKLGSSGEDDKQKKGGGGAACDRPRSQGAYMLIYRRKGKSVVEPHPPPELEAEVNRGNETLVELVTQSEATKKELGEMWTTRKDLCRRVIEETKEAARLSPDERAKRGMKWISAEWWARCVGEEEPGPIDNGKIVCEHGENRVSPARASKMKCITASSWDMLVGQFKGGPVIEFASFCPACLLRAAREVVQRDRDEAHLDEMAKQMERKDVTEGYWISTEWLRMWTKDPDGVTTNMTQLITCPHGGLSVDEKQRKLIDVAPWSFLISQFPGATEFPSHEVKPCELCSKAEEERDSEAATQRPLKQAAKKMFNEVIMGGANLKRAGTFFILGKAWYERWRSWVTTEGNLSKPEPFDNKELLCEHHGKFGVNPFPASPTDKPYILVRPDQWAELKKQFAAPGVIEVTVHRGKEDEDGEFKPEVCWDCVAERTATESKKKQSFKSGKLFIRKL